MGTAANVTTSKPNPKGAVWRAPIGTPLPTGTKDTMNEAFKPLGYVSEDGLTNGYGMDVNETKAWGGDTVLTTESGRSDTFKFTLIEALNVEVLKTVHGDENVSGTLETGITIKVNSNPHEQSAWVFDMEHKGEPKRIAIPAAAVTEVGDIVYKDDEAVGYEITITATPDESGQTHYEYIGGGE